MKIKYSEFCIYGQGDVIYMGQAHENWYHKISRLSSIALF